MKSKSSAGARSGAVSAIVSAMLRPLSVAANAQGLPVDTGSHIPVALWAIGTAVLGLVIAYGIAKNRRRTRAEIQLTERATKDLYAREDQAERSDRSRTP